MLMTPHKFSVPTPDYLPNPATDTDPASVEKRIAQLNYTDLRSLTRSLIYELSLLNRHPDTPPAREQIMAVYQVPCARLVRVRPDRPKNPSSEQMRRLMVEMAYGYKHLINEALRTRNWLRYRRQLTHALYFAAKHLSLELFLSYEAYQCKVSNNWRELLAIYRLAEQHQLHRLQVDDRDQANPGNATIGHILKRILLLRLQDPCCMVSGEARTCFDYFNVLASSATLAEPGRAEAMPGRYLLDLDGVDPPQPLTRTELSCNPGRHRVFNLIPVSQQVHDHLQDMELHNAPPPEGLQRMRELNPNLVLKRILRSWHARQERRDEREAVYGWLMCGFGLSAVNHFLSMTARAKLVSQAAHTRPGGEQLKLMQTAKTANPPARYLRIRCRQVNRSPSGMCIHLQLPSALKPKVGQVVLMQEDAPETQDACHVGVVQRRMRIDADNLEAGIHLIQGNILPIELRQLGGRSDFKAAICVERGEQGMDSLLLPPGIFKSGQEVELKIPARRLMLQEAVDETPSFERFRFSL